MPDAFVARMTTNDRRREDDADSDSEVMLDDGPGSAPTPDDMDTNPDRQPGIPDEPVSPAEGGD